MSKAFTIQSVYNEINGDYFEYDMRDYGEAGSSALQVLPGQWRRRSGGGEGLRKLGRAQSR